jgi:hypothetical protein
MWMQSWTTGATGLGAEAKLRQGCLLLTATTIVVKDKNNDTPVSPVPMTT